MACSLNSFESTQISCPVCAQRLARDTNTFRCEKGHAFDLSKEGYLNLLLSHQRRSSHPGDDDNMIQARRRFFDSGIFDPLIQRVLPSFLIQNPASFSLLDCGCGEGHFLGTLSEMHPGSFYGVDVSKNAIRCAARRYKKSTWIVANAMRSLPFADHSLDGILSVLAPRNPPEFFRILKPDGLLVLGVPGVNHLIELRSQLAEHAPDFEEKADEAVARCAPFFTEIQREAHRYEHTLNTAQLADLIQMTPIFWNSTLEAKERVRQLTALTVTFSMVLLTLKRCDPAPQGLE